MKDFFFFLIRVVIDLLKFGAKFVRFLIGCSAYRVAVVIQRFKVTRYLLVRILEVWSARIFVYELLYKVPQFYSTFASSFSTAYWFRVGLVLLLWPIKYFFNSLLYPMFCTYFYSGVPFYIIFTIFCTLLYLSLLWPRFFLTLRRGDLYVFCVLQVIYIEAAFSMPLTHYYCEPFFLDSLLVVARAHDLFHTPSRSFPFDWNTYAHFRERYIEDEELIGTHHVLPYSELKPVSNELAPQQLYKSSVERPFRLYGFENHRYVDYFFKKHLPIDWKKQISVQLAMWRPYDLLEQFNPVDRCLVWHSGMTPFLGFFGRFGYHDRKVGPIWAKYCYRSGNVRYGARFTRYHLSSEVKGVPDYLVSLLQVPARAPLGFDSRRFERLTRKVVLDHFSNVSIDKLSSVRTSYEFPRIETYDRKSGFHVYLRAQRKLGGVHLSPVLVGDNFYSRDPWPGSTFYHYLFPSFSEYMSNRSLRVLEGWSTFYSERYPVSSLPLMELDTVFSNSRFLGLSVFFDWHNGEKVFFREKSEDDGLSRSFFDSPGYYSPLQRDFTPTYNLDILEFVSRLPGHESRESKFFQFVPGSDYNSSSLGSLHTGFDKDISAFRALSIYGSRGLVFNKFCRFNYYRKFIDSQWYIFTRNKVYDPLSGRTCWTLDSTVWTWGVSQRWIRDSRLVSVYTSSFGVAGRRRMPYPLRLRIPLAGSVFFNDSSLEGLRLFGDKLAGSGAEAQYFLPFQLYRWSEPPFSEAYEIVQNGHWLRASEDYRADLKFRHHPLLSRMRFDSRSASSYIFFPRFFSSPMNRPYHYVLHRSFEEYDWPVYMNDKVRRFAYPRTPVSFQPWRLDTRDPWEVKPIYIHPGYHPKVPKELIHAWDYNIGYFIVARSMSIFYEFMDYSRLVRDDFKLSCQKFFLSFNYRSLDWVVFRSGYNAWFSKTLHVCDDWSYAQLSWLYYRQVRAVRFSLLAYRANDALSAYNSQYLSCVPDAHRAYFRWVAGLLERYFSVYGCGTVPDSVVRKFSDLDFNCLNTCSSGSFLDPESFLIVSKRGLAPSVLVDLQDILDGSKEILSCSDNSVIGTKCQDYVEECQVKFPAESLVRRLDELMGHRQP